MLCDGAREGGRCFACAELRCCVMVFVRVFVRALDATERQFRPTQVDFDFALSCFNLALCVDACLI